MLDNRKWICKPKAVLFPANRCQRWRCVRIFSVDGRRGCAVNSLFWCRNWRVWFWFVVLHGLLILVCHWLLLLCHSDVWFCCSRDSLSVGGCHIYAIAAGHQKQTDRQRETDLETDRERQGEERRQLRGEKTKQDEDEWQKWDRQERRNERETEGVGEERCRHQWRQTERGEGGRNGARQIDRIIQTHSEMGDKTAADKEIDRDKHIRTKMKRGLHRETQREREAKWQRDTRSLHTGDRQLNCTVFFPMPDV